MKKIISFLIVLLFGVYSLMLSYNGKLGLYIHPRFFDESLIAGVIGIIIGIIGLIYSFFHEKDNLNLSLDKKLVFIVALIVCSFIFSPIFLMVAFFVVLIPFKDSKFDKLLKSGEFIGIAIVAIILAAGILLPPKGLSSVTASQRSIDFNAINLTENTISASQNFNRSTKTYTIGDWIAAIGYNPDPNYYKDKDVSVVGFLYRPQNLNLADDEFIVARFIVSCCAVDARPVGLRVKYNLQSDFKSDDWIKVEGKFAINGNDIILIPDTVTKTEAPASPYIF